MTNEEESIWGAGSSLIWLSGIERQDRKVWNLEATKVAVKDYNSHHTLAQRRLRIERRLPMRP